MDINISVRTVIVGLRGCCIKHGTTLGCLKVGEFRY
jgi:hypothetical protein